MIGSIGSSMDQEFASQVVERYLAVLDETAQMSGGVSESMLPCSQTSIKEAIKFVLAQTPEGSDEYHRLRAAYPKLATFLPDAEAEIAAKAEEAVISMDMGPESARILEEHARILIKVRDEGHMLSEELYTYLDSIGH